VEFKVRAARVVACCDERATHNDETGGTRRDGYLPCQCQEGT